MPAAKAKAADKSIGPSSWWIPLPQCADHFQCQLRTIYHLRGPCGVYDAAKIAHVIGGGTHRIHYRVECFEDGNAPSHRKSDMLVLGVCDANAFEAEASMSRRVPEQRAGEFSHGACVAWGLCLSTGRVISSPSLTKVGQLDSAANTEDVRLTPRSRLLPARASRTVVVEVSIPDFSTDFREKRSRRPQMLDEDACGPAPPPSYLRELCALRQHDACTLHPNGKRDVSVLDEQRLVLQRDVARLAFSVDGGPFEEALNVPRLSSSLLPWVALGRGGDAVTLVAIERLVPEAK